MTLLLNGLGFVNTPLYLDAGLLQDEPVKNPDPSEEDQAKFTLGRALEDYPLC